MFQDYLELNKKLLALYILLFLSMAIGITLTWDRDTYIQDMLFVILQIWMFLTIPNIIYLIIKRKQKDAIHGFLKMVLLIPILYILLAMIMGILLVYN